VVLRIPNDVDLLPIAANRVTADLYTVRAINSSHLYSLNLAIFECLTNALEHGNLKLGYDEKTDLLQSGTYLQKLKERCRLPANQASRITLEYSLGPQELRISISDEGDGFDTERVLKDARATGAADYHGRGLLLASKMVDAVEFND